MTRLVDRPRTDEATDAGAIGASLQDPDRFAALYDRHAARLYHYAYRRVGHDAADDVVAGTFLVAYRHRRRYDLTRPDALPWLFGILTREVARHRRTEKARYRALGRLAPDPVTADPADRVADDVSAQSVRAVLAQALAALSAGDRDVLLLIAWGSLAYDEVAQALDIPVGTVRSRLNRARRKTRAALGGSNPTDFDEEWS